MTDIVIERAFFRREQDKAPRLLGRSPDLAERLLESLMDLLVLFGERAAGVLLLGSDFCPAAGG